MQIESKSNSLVKLKIKMMELILFRRKLFEAARYVFMIISNFWQKLKINWAGFHCDNCQKSISAEDILKNGEETGTVVCGACCHKLEVRYLDEAHPFYSFDYQTVKACETVHLQREEAISIIDKNWKNRFAKVWALASIAVALLLGFAFYYQWSQFSSLGFEVLAAMVVLSIVLLVCFYKFLQMWLNHSRLMLKKDRIVIGHLPLSFQNYRVVMFDKIKGFSLWKRKGQVGPLQFRFGLYLVTNEGEEIYISPCSAINEALYLEKTLLELIHIEQTELKEVED